MTRIEIERLANAINILRPDWPAEHLIAFLTKHASTRPLWDAARVLVWIATEPGQIDGQHVHTDPVDFTKPGPWWDAITITEQTDRRFRGHFIYSAGRKDFFGVVYPDNQTFTWVASDSKGYNHGKILAPDRIAACYVEPGEEATAGCAELVKETR